MAEVVSRNEGGSLVEQNRREFLTAAACLGAASMLKKSNAAETGAGGGSMLGFAAPPLAKVRVAVAPSFADNPISHLSSFPGVEITALCARNEADLKFCRSIFEKRKLPPPKEYVGADACKRMVDDRVADVFFNSMSVLNNTEANVYAMNGKMHVFFLPPLRCSVDDCWELVEASECNKVHCSSVGNRCYDPEALFALNVMRSGLLGDIVACDGTYFRDARNLLVHGRDKKVAARWGVRMSAKGMSYPWERPFAALFRCLDVNHGDRLETVVSMSTENASLAAFASVQKGEPVPAAVLERGCDMNAALVRTSKGRLVTLRHALAMSCPYHAPFGLYGTNGVLQCGLHGGIGINGGIRMAYDSIPGGGKSSRFFDDNTTQEMLKKFEHPLNKIGGQVGKNLRGHFGGKQMEDMCRIYCLRYGLPMGTDVYDFATLASLMKLTDKSARANGKSIEVPDFTRGAWKSAAPRPIEDVDVEKFFSV